MPDDDTTSTSSTDDATGQTTAQSTTDSDDATDSTDWKAEARKWEQRAKEHGTKVKEYEKQQRASMNDAEKALAEAESRGRDNAAKQYGTRLVRTEFDAAAGRRNPDFDATAALEYVDLTKFLGEDGEPDTKAIKAAVERLVPAPNGTPAYDGGSRSTARTGTDMNQIIRKAAGRA